MAMGVVTNIIQPKHTKAMDMRFHWLCCRTNQQQFHTYWHARSTNLANYVTKLPCAHSSSYHPSPVSHSTNQIGTTTAERDTFPHQTSPAIYPLQPFILTILWTASATWLKLPPTHAPHWYHCKGVLYMSNQWCLDRYL
jgi:hypothetical protein